jgi:hypothetical protein
MICSRCQFDLDIAFHQIALLQKQVAYLQKKTGYQYVEPKIGDPIAEEVQTRDMPFEVVWDKIPDNSLQRVFRDLDDRALWTVLQSLDTPERIAKFRRSVSANHFARLLDEIRLAGIVDASSARTQFLIAADRLEHMGEIVIDVQSHEEYVEMLRNSKPLSADEVKKMFEGMDARRQEKLEKAREWFKMAGLEYGA